jgi:hypothetical protein
MGVIGQFSYFLTVTHMGLGRKEKVSLLRVFTVGMGDVISLWARAIAKISAMVCG